MDRLTYCLMNPEDYRLYMSTLSPQQYWTNWINHVVMVKNELVCPGNCEMVRESMLAYVSRKLGW